MSEYRRHPATPVRYELSLEENATDSLVHGVEHLQEFVETDEQRHIKYVIIHVYHAVELFLKAAVVRHDPTMIYTKPGVVGSRTIGLEEAVERLKQYGVDVSPGLAYLKNLKFARNPIEHHALNADEDQLIRHVARAMSFLDAFTETELNIVIRDELEERLDGDHYRIVLDHLYDFQERLEAIERQVAQFQFNPSTEEFYEHLFCPNCGNPTVVYPDPTLGYSKVHCFLCDMRFEPRGCSRCGNIVLDISEQFDETSVCDDCWEDLLSSED